MPTKQGRRRDVKGARGWVRVLRTPLLLPLLVALVLCLPDLSLGYIWDDYYFLTFRGTGDFRAYLLPDPNAAFYRPISQWLYFAFLRLIDPSNGTLGHILNLALLIGALALLSLLVTRLRCERSGLLSALVLGICGLAPSLVAWVSCSQDLLAVVFVLAAFLLQDQGKREWAFLCALAGVLCKEPAIAAFPVLVLWDRLVERQPVRTRLQVAAYATAGLAWVLIHPGVRALLARGFQSGATGYVGMEHPERWALYLARYVLSLVNLPPPGLTQSWPTGLTGYGTVAAVLLVAGLLFLERHGTATPTRKGVPLGRVGWIAVLFGVPTLLMPALLIRHWAPYFAFIPAVALAIFLGPLLATQRTRVVVPALLVLLFLGLVYRGTGGVKQPVWTERVFTEAARATKEVRSDFRTLFPDFPRGSQVVVSVSATGVRGIYSTLMEGQALQVWYQDPTIHTILPERRRTWRGPEFLFRLTSDLDLFEIDPDRGFFRGGSGLQPHPDEIGRTIRSYARGVAASGEPDRAVAILTRLADVDGGLLHDYDLRLAAMVRYSEGKVAEAERLKALTPAPGRGFALDMVGKVFAEPSSAPEIDSLAFRAFDVSPDDTSAVRHFLRMFRDSGYPKQACAFAQRMMQLVPGDGESATLLQRCQGRRLAGP